MNAGADDVNKLMALAAGCDIVGKIFLGDVGDCKDIVSDLSARTWEDNRAYLDDFATVHHALFALNIFPFGNVYLSNTMMAGGDLGTTLSDLYTDCGFTPPAEVSPDHAGVQFAAAAHMLLSAVEYWRHGDQKNADAAKDLLSVLLERGMVPSLLPISSALLCESQTFAANFGQVVCSLACELAALTSGACNTGSDSVPDDDLVPPLDAGLRDLVSYLITPCRSGFWLSSGDIRALAGQHALPCGFSTREDMLTNLLHSAGTYDKVAPLLDSVRDIARKRQKSLSSWRSSGQSPIIEVSIKLNESRLNRTTSLLEQLRQHANSSKSLI